MKSALEHVSYQLPNQSTRVRFLLDTIKCTDSLLMARIANIQCDQDPKEKLYDFEKAIAFLLLACPVALRIARRGDSIVDNKATEISAMTLKEGVGRTGVKLRWYPRKSFAALSEEQKDKLRKFTNSAVGKKQKEANTRSKTQIGGQPNKKQKTNNNANSGSIFQGQVTKIEAAIVKMGKQKEKETSKFNQGMKKISALLVDSVTPAQVEGIGGEVDTSSDIDKHNEKMVEVAVVFKSFMRKRGNRSKKNNGDNDEE